MRGKVASHSASRHGTVEAFGEIGHDSRPQDVSLLLAQRVL